MDEARDKGLALNPKYDRDGLITAVVTDADSGELLMVAHMNAKALQLTRDTGLAHFWSRSRQSLWKKGETSGHMLKVRDLRIDRSEEHTSELQSLMRISYAVFCLKKKTTIRQT